jgi:hypothetical protein
VGLSLHTGSRSFSPSFRHCRSAHDINLFILFVHLILCVPLNGKYSNVTFSFVQIAAMINHHLSPIQDSTTAGMTRQIGMQIITTRRGAVPQDYKHDIDGPEL